MYIEKTDSEMESSVSLKVRRDLVAEQQRLDSFLF